MRKITSNIVLFMLLFLMSSPAHSPVIPSPEVHSPIIRILFRNQTLCTAFVISNELAITANHCISEFNPDFTISNQNKTHYQRFEIFGTKERIDIAMIRADFRLYKKLPIKKINNGIQDSPSPFKSCGYAHGGKLLCFPWVFTGIKFFYVQGNSFLYGGMSGGPLIDGNGFAVGVNSSVSDRANISPLVNILEDFGINTEE